MVRVKPVGLLIALALAPWTASSNASGQTFPDVAPLQCTIEALERELHDRAPEGSPERSSPDVAPAGRTKTVEESIEELASQMKILARQVEIDKEAAAERAGTTPQPGAGRAGFSLQSSDGNFRIRFRGYMHADGRFFLNDLESRGVDTFLLRRVRPIVEATMYGMFDFRVMTDFGNGATVLQDAYVDARLSPQFKIRAGKFKPPIGFERLMSATELTFIERAFPTALVPNRDLGLMVHGDVVGGNLAYAVGVFNGVPDGGSADLDIQDGKEVAGRVFVQPFRTRRDSVWQGFGVGIAGSYGDHRGASAAANGLPTFRTAGQTSFFAFRGDDPVLGPVLANGTRTRISPQAHFYYGPFGVIAEHVISSQDVKRGASTATLDDRAWQVAGSWVLTGETPSYRGVTPRAPFDRRAGNWGAFEVTARYSEIDADRATFPTFANPATAAGGAKAWATGFNWLLNNAVKLQINYEQTRFENLGTVRRDPEHDLITRVQFAF
jgi:phosphate-selective porin OprO/OprP